jgi:hypothetical protein
LDGGATVTTTPTQDPLILQGFFVATDAEIAALDLDDVPLQIDLPHMEWKRITSVELGTLEARLTGVDYDAIDKDSLHNDYYVANEMEGPWYTTVRQELVDALVGMTPDRTEAVVRDWLATDEWRMAYPSGAEDPRVVAELTSLVNELARLALEAKSRNATIYLMQTL